MPNPNRRARLVSVSSLALGFCALGITAVQAQQYTLTDVGNLGTLDSTFGYGINDAGQVTGAFPNTADIANHAFLYSSGTMQDLESLIGPHGLSNGYGINASGEVAGTSEAPNTPNADAFLYSNGTMHDLGNLGGTGLDGYSESDGQAINNYGQVAGYTTVGIVPGTVHAFIDTNGSMKDLGSFGGNSFAYGINDSGQVGATPTPCPVRPPMYNAQSEER